jgi:hypothetical protein
MKNRCLVSFLIKSAKFFPDTVFFLRRQNKNCKYLHSEVYVNNITLVHHFDSKSNCFSAYLHTSC